MVANPFQGSLHVDRSAKNHESARAESQPDATFNPPYSDSGLDTNGNGLYDYLEVSAIVNVTVNGTYGLGGMIYDNLSSPFSYIEMANSTTYLEAGMHTFNIDFDGMIIRAHGVDGPYIVVLYLLIGSVEIGQDSYNTSMYSMTQFEIPSADLQPPYTDFGLDTDGDGYYNYLVFDATINVSLPASYIVDATFMEYNRQYITSESNTTFLTIGVHEMEFRMDGTYIVSLGMDGPYRVQLMLRNATLDRLDLVDLVTSNYTVADFGGMAWTSHAPILIDGDSGFTNASGVVRGSGSAVDPFVIEGWDISASSAAGIKIQDTTASFVVRYCNVHDGVTGPSGGNPGIYLESCINGALIGNHCSNDWDGVQIYSSSNITVNRNSCTSNGWDGMFLYFSSDNTLIDNICSSSFDDGIHLWSSCENTLANNSCMHNYRGVELYSSSSDNTMIDNSCSYNALGLYISSSSNNNTLTQNNCSLNSGAGIFLDSACNNNAIVNNNCSSNTDYGILLSSCGDNLLTDNRCNSNFVGITVSDSDNNDMISNTCSNNHCGIGLYGSSNSILRNSFHNNTLYGVQIGSGSSNNRVWNNTFIGNNNATDTFDSSCVQAYDDGFDNWWNSTDGHGNFWNDWTTPDANGDGIVDEPYLISGGAEAKDYCPLVSINSLPERKGPGLSSELFVLALVGVVAIVAAMVVFLLWMRRKKPGQAGSKPEEPPPTPPKT